MSRIVAGMTISLDGVSLIVQANPSVSSILRSSDLGPVGS
jgi:hypothetical protein